MTLNESDAIRLLNNFIAADWSQSYLTTDGEVHPSCILPFGRVLKYILPRSFLKEVFSSDAEKGIAKIQEAYTVAQASTTLSADAKAEMSQKLVNKATEFSAKVKLQCDLIFAHTLITPIPTSAPEEVATTAEEVQQPEVPATEDTSVEQQSPSAVIAELPDDEVIVLSPVESPVGETTEPATTEKPSVQNEAPVATTSKKQKKRKKRRAEKQAQEQQAPHTPKKQRKSSTANPDLLDRANTRQYDNVVEDFLHSSQLNNDE